MHQAVWARRDKLRLIRQKKLIFSPPHGLFPILPPFLHLQCPPDSLNGCGAGPDLTLELVNVGAWMALGVTLWIVAGSSDIILFDVTLWIVAGSGARMTLMLRSRLTLHNNVRLALQELLILILA